MSKIEATDVKERRIAKLEDTPKKRHSGDDVLTRTQDQKDKDELPTVGDYLTRVDTKKTWN